MTNSAPLNVLVIGDPFFDSSIFAAEFEPILARHQVRFHTITADGGDGGAGDGRRNVEIAVDEYIGSSDQVIALLRDDDDVLVVHGAPVTARVLDAAPALKLVCVGRGGPVNVDHRAAAARGVRIVTTPGKNAEAVAELTLALMIMLARNIAGSSAELRTRTAVAHSAYEGAEWFGRELGGARVGLVGLGRVGRCVADRAHSLGMAVQGVDPFVGSDVPDHVSLTSLDDLLATSDFVSLHARVTSENVGMMGAEQFRRMRPDAYFVNTARASLVDEDALATALTEGWIAGAAVDVLGPHAEGSPHPLTTLDRVIATPHIGGATAETLVRGARMLALALERYATGQLRDDETPSLIT
jgi:D-3-phosphoglycerate dehydrogenase